MLSDFSYEPYKSAEKKRFWYRLVDSTGKPYHNTLPSALILPCVIYVADLKSVIKEEHSINHIPGCVLAVYKNKRDFIEDRENNELDPALYVDGLGMSLQTCMIILVPDAVSYK